ncbi:ABC transporter permease [Dehalococcoidia bacterium]|nr:ABC transporter permease [Dehalococcoidia bacterium]
MLAPQSSNVHLKHPFRFLFWFVKTKPLGAIGGIIIITLFITSIFASHITPYHPFEHNIDNRLSPPNSEFLFGTDTFGRDLFSRIIYGISTSLYVGLVSVSIATIIGTPIGIVSATLGKPVDIILQRVVDGFMAFPSLVLALIIVASFGASTLNVGIAITIVLIPQTIRLARAQSLRIQTETYITAAISIGVSPSRIIWRHILPNMVTSIVVLLTGFVGEAVVVEASLSFLGLGIPPPQPSWGRMIQEGAFLYLETAPWITIIPGLALSLLVLSFAFLGDAIRDILDPHIQEL